MEDEKNAEKVFSELSEEAFRAVLKFQTLPPEKREQVIALVEKLEAQN